MGRTNKSSQKDAGHFIVNKMPFKASALSGVYGTTDPGRMSDDETREYRQSNPNYTVKSYGTPNAWHGDAGWQISTTKYTPTTSKHQGVVRRAVFNQGHDNAKM